MQILIPCLGEAAKRRLLVLILLPALLLPGHLWAQSNPLNRKITLRLNNVPLENALDAIGDKGGFSFSYNPDLLRTDSLVDVQARRDPVKDVLENIMGKRMVYTPIANHVVIRRRAEAPLPVAPPESYLLEGFLIDGATGEPVHFGTVYENFKRRSILTDGKGYYQLEVPGEARQVALSFSKRGYRDTVVVVRPERESSITVGLMPIPGWDQPVASRPVSLVGDSDDDLPLVEFLVPENQRDLAFNVKSALMHFPVQISLVPSIGTNRLLSGAMNNHFSLNILGGYANSVQGVELGGLFNIDREDVTGFQVAGLTNIVGGNVKGMQTAGLFNNVRGSMNGMQTAGLYNLVKDSARGIQVAGLFNHTRGKVSGIQAAGLFNKAGQGVDGAQAAGLFNHCRGDVRAMQIAGLANSAENVGFFQVAGLINRAGDEVKGFQISGLANRARGRVAGFQISGLLNKAARVDGIQIGLVNIADTIGGAQIGLLNITKTGYTCFELSANETMQANLAYKAGNRRFHSILSVGARFNNGSQAFGYGAGLGTLQDLGPLTLGVEVLCQQIVEGDVGGDRLNLLIPGRINLGLKLGPVLELYGGASANLHLSNGFNYSTDEFVSGLGASPFWRDDNGRTLKQAWVGYQAGLRVNLHGSQESERKEKKKAEREERRQEEE